MQNNLFLQKVTAIDDIQKIIRGLYGYNKKMNEKGEQFIEREKYETYVKQRQQLKHDLLDTLTADQRELYKIMEQVQSEINEHTNMEFYFMGFKMGGRFILEILGDGKVSDVSN